MGIGVAKPDDIAFSWKPHAPTDGGRSASCTRGAAHPRASLRAVFLGGCFALCRAARCTPRTTCSCLVTCCHPVVGFVPPRGRLCPTPWWALCHHLVGLVPPRVAVCATTWWALCQHAVRFVLPCGGPRTTTWRTRCFHGLGFVPPCSGMAGCCRQPLPCYYMRVVEGASPVARQVQPLSSSSCFPFHAAAHVL